MFDNKKDAEAHAQEEFNKVFPESKTTSIKTPEPEVSKIARPELKTKIARADKIASGIDKASAKIRDGLTAYNTVGSAIRRNFDFDAAMENVWNMDGAFELFGSRRKKAE
jgi:hypothetical protein